VAVFGVTVAFNVMVFPALSSALLLLKETFVTLI
jgi:hypothetical protein